MEFFMSSAFRILVLIAVLSALTICVFGQDLGSSNKLFGGAKTGTKTVKKASAKHRPAASKVTASPRKRVTSSKTSKTTSASTHNAATAKPKSTGKVDSKTSKIEIKPAVKEPATPTTAEAEAQFEKFIMDGNSARDARDYSAAEYAYKRARALKPKDARAVYGLGNLYSDQQRWEDAERAYRTALEFDPKDAVAHLALSYVLTQPIALPNLADRYEEAEKLARRSIELGSANALAFDQLGVAMELRGLISTETENAYRKSIALDPSFAPAYAHLGRLLRRRGLTKESETAYQNAIQHSTDVATTVLVADVMQSEQRYAESEKLLRMAVASDPKNPSALLLLGRALTAEGNFPDAEKILRRSLESSPDGFMPNSLLGSLYSRQGKFDLAENALLQAMKFVANGEKRGLSQQFETVGDGYFKTGKRQDAMRAYRQAIALDAGNTTLAAKLAKTHGG